MANPGRNRGAERKALYIFLLLAVLAVFPPCGALGHDKELPDDILKQIGVDEKPGGQVPSGLLFTDSEGRKVLLEDSFGDGPILLTLNYYTCPMLCPLILRNLLMAVDRMGGISLGRDFRIVTVSVDPNERPEAARARAGEMHAMMKETREPETRWLFLYGGGEGTGRLADAVGVRYRKVGDEIAHPNVVIVLTAEGKISRYLYGIDHDPRDLKLALIEAADGRIGESAVLNRALMFCFHYDPVERKYSLYARNIMKAGGAATLAFLGLLYLAVFRRKASRTDSKAGGVG